MIDRAIGNEPNQQRDVIQWPTIGERPINEFNTEGYIARAFPTLFPKGDADLHSPRLQKVNPSPYFKHLMKYRDGRFAKSLRFRFFAMNSMLRWTAIQNSTICVRRNVNLRNI